MSQVFSINIMKGGYEQCHLGQVAHYHQDHVMPFGQGQPLNEVHQDGVPRSFADWEELMWTKGLVMEGLAATAD